MIPGADIEDRIEKCQKILESEPNSQIFAALAEALRRKGELDQAFRVCQGGLRLHPGYGSAHIVMAKINLDRGLYDWAEAEVKRAIEIEGNSRTIELLLAEIFIFKGEFASAVKLLRKLSQADPNNDQIRKLLDIAQQLPNEQAALLEPKAPRSGRIEIRGGQHRPIPIPNTPLAPPPPAVAAPVSSSRMTSAEILGQAVSIPDVDGALFVNFEGLVVESEWASRLDASACAAATADVSKLLNQELIRASFGQLETILIETADPMFYIVRVADGLFLFYGNRRVNLGTLRKRIASLIDIYGVR
jgi:predicted regulator of Ras-like GTPase activity (Roadblock/LC7/MglB family)